MCSETKMADSILQVESRGIFVHNRVSFRQQTTLPLIMPLLKLDIVIPCSSSSTPTVPYSTADILYGSDVHGGGSRNNIGAEDMRQNGCMDSDRTKDGMRQKVKDIDNPNNRRPNSKNGKQRPISIDTGNLLLHQLVHSITWSKTIHNNLDTQFYDKIFHVILM